MSCYIIPDYMLKHSEPLKQSLQASRALRGMRTLSLVSTGFRKAIQIYDAHGQDAVGTLIADGGQLADNSPKVLELQGYLNTIQNFFKTVFDYDLQIDAVVNYGESFSNAFFDGEYIRFGNGDGEVFGLFTKSLNVMAHELGHAVIGKKSGLGYEGENGAINESYADVFGQMCEQWSNRQAASESSWVIGDELILPWLRSTSLKGVRDMKDPGTAYNYSDLGGKDPQPASYKQVYKGSQDYGGVHINSGILNKAFVLACEGVGGYSWETFGRVWWNVLPKLTESSKFSDLVKLTLAETKQNSLQANILTQAWKAVGLL